MLKKALLVTVSAGLLSACANTWDVEGVKGLQPTGDSFQQALFSEYVAIAEAERDRYDWNDTAYFLDKARAAAAGQMVLPDQVSDRDIDTLVAEATAARGDLVAVLDGGARTRLPQVAAKAQASYDCWLEELEEGHQPSDIKSCRDHFQAAMDELTAQPQPAATPAAEYTVTFPLGGSLLDPQARTTLDTVLSAWQDAKPARVVIAGHTDTVGDTVSNLLLSQKRAEAVATYLEAAGMPAAAMALEAYGEEQPTVKTGDGVAEPANRRVEIVFADAE